MEYINERRQIIAAMEAANQRTGRDLTIVHACAPKAAEGHRFEVMDVDSTKIVFNGTNDQILDWFNAQ